MRVTNIELPAMAKNCLLLETMIFLERQPQTALRGTFDFWSAIKLIYVVKCVRADHAKVGGGEAEKSAAGRPDADVLMWIDIL